MLATALSPKRWPSAGRGRTRGTADDWRGEASSCQGLTGKYRSEIGPSHSSSYFGTANKDVSEALELVEEERVGALGSEGGHPGTVSEHGSGRCFCGMVRAVGEFHRRRRLAGGRSGGGQPRIRWVYQRAPRSMAISVRLVGLVASPRRSPIWPRLRQRFGSGKTTKGRSPESSGSRWASCDVAKASPWLRNADSWERGRYEDTWERIRIFVVGEVDMAPGSGPVPMDIGHAHTKGCGEWATRKNGTRKMWAPCRRASVPWVGTRRGCPTAVANTKREPKGKKGRAGASEGRRQRR